MAKDTRTAAWVKILALTHVCGNTIAWICWISCCSGNPVGELSGKMNASADDNGTCAILECSSTVGTVDVVFVWTTIINGGTVVAAIVACIGWSSERYLTNNDDTKETAALLYDLYVGSGCILRDYSYDVTRARLRSRRCRRTWSVKSYQCECFHTGSRTTN